MGIGTSVIVHMGGAYWQIATCVVGELNGFQGSPIPSWCRVASPLGHRVFFLGEGRWTGCFVVNLGVL